MEELLKKYKEYKELLKKYSYCGFILSYDAITDCPKLDRPYSDEIQEWLYNKELEITLSDDYINLIYALNDKKDELDEITKLDIEIEYKELVKINKIPKDELKKHITNSYKSAYEWEEARKTLDYSKFLVELKELVEFNKKYIKWEETDTLKGYDVLLDDMEEGYNQKMYDEFFEKIEKDLLPFVKEVLTKEQKYNKKLDTLKFDISKQKELTKKIASAMEYDDNVGCIRETVHPFTNWANNKDVRITTRYQEDLLFSNLYSVMHEIGHALFQLHMDDKYNDTNIFNNVTCITHESQSRFYENYLGRSRAFIEYLYPILVELYPKELEGITVDDIYYYVNSVKAQFNRCEADELTYPLHVLIRYNVEKKLFNGEIDVDKMEETFNYYMKEYLGITPPNKLIGVFQDSHWSSGFGYFPTYALGSAYGAMFYQEMKKDLDVDAELRKGNFKNINIWLTEKIHKFSGTKKNLEIVKDVCKIDFDPDIYIKYLKDKFTEIYK